MRARADNDQEQQMNRHRLDRFLVSPSPDRPGRNAALSVSGYGRWVVEAVGNAGARRLSPFDS
jgi:hypothetical protein